MPSAMPTLYIPACQSCGTRDAQQRLTRYMPFALPRLFPLHRHYHLSHIGVSKEEPLRVPAPPVYARALLRCDSSCADILTFFAHTRTHGTRRAFVAGEAGDIWKISNSTLADQALALAGLGCWRRGAMAYSAAQCAPRRHSW